MSEFHNLTNCAKSSENPQPATFHGRKRKKELDALEQSEVEGIKQVEAVGLKISLLSRYRNALGSVATQEQLEKIFLNLALFRICRIRMIFHSAGLQPRWPSRSPVRLKTI